MTTTVEPGVAASGTTAPTSGIAGTSELKELVVEIVTAEAGDFVNMFACTYPAGPSGKVVFDSPLRFHADMVQRITDAVLRHLGIGTPQEAHQLDTVERAALYQRLEQLRTQSGATLGDILRVRTIDNRTVAIQALESKSIKMRTYRYEDNVNCAGEGCMYAHIVKFMYAFYAVALDHFEAQRGVKLPEPIPASRTKKATAA
jgi:hypothetical protein